MSCKSAWVEFEVTILILIDGFLQLNPIILNINTIQCHNPYFNRWFSAINTNSVDIDLIKSSQSLF